MQHVASTSRAIVQQYANAQWLRLLDEIHATTHRTGDKFLLILKIFHCWTWSDRKWNRYRFKLLFFFLKKKNHSSLKENVIETPQENSARFFFLNAASWHAATLELASDSLQLHGTRSGNRFKLQYNASTICWKREKQRDVQHGNGQLHREVLLRFAEQKCNATSVRIRLADTN